jgi:hypothetical protein
MNDLTSNPISSHASRSVPEANDTLEHNAFLIGVTVPLGKPQTHGHGTEEIEDLERNGRPHSREIQGCVLGPEDRRPRDTTRGTDGDHCCSHQAFLLRERRLVLPVRERPRHVRLCAEDRQEGAE